MTAGIGYSDHPAAWPMRASHPRTLDVGWEGRCACRWRGPWRVTETAAAGDVAAHLAAVGADVRAVVRAPAGG